MPKYTYRCNSCESIMEISHSMDEKLVDCHLCEQEGSLKKIMNTIAVQYKDKKDGKIVEDYIKEAKIEVAQEKENLKNREHNS